MYIARYEADDLFGHDNAEHESVLRKSETNRTYRKTRGREENPVLYFTLLGKWLTEQRLGKRVQKGKFLLQKKKLWRAMINTIEEVNLFYSLKIRLFFWKACIHYSLALLDFSVRFSIIYCPG